MVAARYPEVQVRRSDENIGIWAGMERLLGETDAPYVLVLTDVVMASDFVERGVRVLERERDIGAVQSRMLQGVWTEVGLRREPRIDSLGFAVSRGRRVTNLAQGEPDRAIPGEVVDIFGVEGAAPLFRRSALQSCRIGGHLIDPDYRIGALGYGDDLDVAWRMRLLGHRQVLVPGMRAWHCRSTTKGLGRGIVGRVRRVHARRDIALEKRRLDWANVRFTMVKNDQWPNLIRHAPWIIGWQLMTLGYMALFEPRVFGAVGRFVRLLPRMLERRREVMQRARMTPEAMRTLFT
jgi:GT2 family glycosyltransferase